MNLTAREREIVDLLRADPLLDAAALAERIGSTRAAVSVHLSNLTRKGVVLGRGYIVRPEAGSVVVVGGAVLDTKVRTASAPKAVRSTGTTAKKASPAKATRVTKTAKAAKATKPAKATKSVTKRTRPSAS